MVDEGTAAKLIGIFGGTVLALVFSPPRTITGFLRRTAAALICGWLFGPAVIEYIGWDNTAEHTAASFALASYGAWWGLGAITKIASRSADKRIDDA